MQKMKKSFVKIGTDQLEVSCQAQMIAQRPTNLMMLTWISLMHDLSEMGAKGKILNRFLRLIPRGSWTLALCYQHSKTK